MVLGALLAVTGAIMMFFGPYWWNCSLAGMYVSQIHFWAAEMLVTLLFVRMFVNFSTFVRAFVNFSTRAYKMVR